MQGARDSGTWQVLVTFCNNVSCNFIGIARFACPELVEGFMSVRTFNNVTNLKEKIYSHAASVTYEKGIENENIPS